MKTPLSPIVFLLLVYADVDSCLYLCFTTFDFIFGGQYGFSSSEAGLATSEEALARSRTRFICGVAANIVSRDLTEQHGEQTPASTFRFAT
jgi:hypothetical protein